MNISSAQTTYSSSSVDVLDFSSLDTINITQPTIIGGAGGFGGNTGSYSTVTLGGTGASGTYTISNGGAGSISIGPITSIDISLFPTEWENSFPEWNRIQKMCEEYPGLKIAFEKFKTTYLLVKDDYDAPPNKKIRP